MAVLDSILTLKEARIFDRAMIAFEEMFGFGEIRSEEEEYESWCSANGSFSCASTSEGGDGLASTIEELQEGFEESKRGTSPSSDDASRRNKTCSAKRSIGSVSSKQPGKKAKPGSV